MNLQTPFAELLPPLASTEFNALEASIKADGVRDPIITDEVGNILDGHHRYKIAPNSPQRVVSGLSPAGKLAFVLSSNLHRRNLSPDQKAALRERQIEIAGKLKEEGKTQEEIAILLGTSRSTVDNWLDISIVHLDKAYDNRVKVPKDFQSEILDRADTGDTHDQIAADFGISQPRVTQICAAERKRREREAELEQQATDIIEGRVTAETGPFDVIVIDPPWPYGTEYDPSGRRAANPYPEMPLADIAALDVAARAAPNCILWLWTTHKFMRHSFPLLDAWGFEEKAIATWIKDRMGLGTWLRSQSEFVIMAARGSPEVALTNQTTIFSGALREHSRKPDEFYSLVEGLCRGPRRYDWFGREGRKGWLIGGNDIGRFAA